MAEDATPETAEAAATADVGPAPDTSGWYRNASHVELTVQPDRYPSARLKPGQATWLPADPQHPDLQPCDAPEPDAADTTGSEK